MKRWLYIILLSLSYYRVCAQQEPELLYPELLSRVDTSCNEYLCLDRYTTVLRTFQHLLDSCRFAGLNKYHYHYADLYERTDATIVQQERWLADGLLAYFTDLSLGASSPDRVSYDALGSAYREQDKDDIVASLSLARSEADMRRIAAGFEPDSHEYLILKQAMAIAINNKNSDAEKKLANTLNCYRWMLHFRFNHFILVNIASAQLKYYNVNFPLLDMKIVAGKPSTRTPRFTAYLDQIIFYPYWHVPRSIAVNELLPASKKNPAILNAMNIQVLNQDGVIVAAKDVPWSKLSKSNFPYQLRQGTGCDNALGVIKFNLTSPYSVYLHDTNLKSVFASSQRYYSHGCIRIEKPEALAMLLAPGKVDSNFLRACVRGQKPVTETLQQPVPIFVLYMTADVNDTLVSYYPDIYQLEK